MYLWTLVGRDPTAMPISSGTAADLARAMRVTEPSLESDQAFVAIIEEVRIRIDVAGLEERYVATGRTWHGRLTTKGSVRWAARMKSGDVTDIYRIPDDLCNGLLADFSVEEQAESDASTQPDGESPSGDAPRWDACDSGSSQSPSREQATPPSAVSPRPPKNSASTPSSVPTTT